MPFSVFETVILGRTPQVGLFHGTGAKDRQKVEETLKLFGIFELKDQKNWAALRWSIAKGISR